MRHSSYTYRILNKTTWITGCPRSGTTILGKILSTLKGVEYSFEPETLFSLLPLIQKINKKNWSDIYENYLIEDLFYNLCTGRKINLKQTDDSSIFHSLNKKQINKKLKLNLRRKDFDRYLKKNKKILIIKAPSLASSFVKLQNYYPQNKFIVTKRSNSALISSMVQKGWFKKSGHLYLPKYISKYGLETKSYKTWINSNEKEKIQIYINLVEKHLKKIKKKYIVNYEQLIKNPNKVVGEICNYLNLKKTHKTKEIIEQVHNRRDGRAV
ncbi:MAG: hypothetical protein CMI95_01245, partial [Pelagibacteraceae bacterium]|nr:hypothetical protein [Pelagibacteraceae bacterium]